MPDVLSPETFVDGDGFSSARVNNAIGNLTILPAFISAKGLGTPVLSDLLVFYSVGGGILQQVPISTILALSQAAIPAAAVNSGAGVTLDASLFDTFQVTLTANTTLTISNISNGQTVAVETLQDGVGGRTLAWSTTQTRIYPFGSIIPVSTAIAARDLWMFKRIGNNIWVTQLPNGS